MKLIILDRDGVINHDSDDYIKSPEEWIPIPGSLDAIARLNHAGYMVAIASNQSGIARGYFSLETLAAMNVKMNEMLSTVGGRIDAMFYCPHGPKDDCGCRKPKPGLLEEISNRFQIGLGEVMFVGDNINDVRAARAAGAKPVIVKTGKGEETASMVKQVNGYGDIPVYNDLNEVVNDLLQVHH
ncbi:MAG: D-glycero-beta-D-manno-heptose 1,7-bisphosphate 7-phosphatase [Thiotrichales bacterium]|nr:MAG: D-glycero-beta-D-manno-heptose 1,7-bisphosphate 7-phosphatase [Thiotrichales bacterium]